MTTPNPSTRTQAPASLRKAVEAQLAADPLTPDRIRSFARSVRDGVSRVYGGDAPAFYRAAGITRFQYSKLLSHPESRHPSKDTVLRMALALRFPPDEAAAFLALAGYALSPCLPADRVWAACFEFGLYHLPSVRRLLAKHASPRGMASGGLRRRTPARALKQVAVEATFSARH